MEDMIKLETELAFPIWAKPFYLYSDTSDVQLSATLIQDGKPLSFYTRKLKAAQTNYTIGEKNYWDLWKAPRLPKKSCTNTE